MENRKFLGLILGGGEEDLRKRKAQKRSSAQILSRVLLRDGRHYQLHVPGRAPRSSSFHAFILTTNSVMGIDRRTGTFL